MSAQILDDDDVPTGGAASTVSEGTPTKGAPVTSLPKRCVCGAACRDACIHASRACCSPRAQLCSVDSRGATAPARGGRVTGHTACMLAGANGASAPRRGRSTVSMPATTSTPGTRARPRRAESGSLWSRCLLVCSSSPSPQPGLRLRVWREVPARAEVGRRREMAALIKAHRAPDVGSGVQCP